MFIPMFSGGHIFLEPFQVPYSHSNSQTVIEYSIMNWCQLWGNMLPENAQGLYVTDSVIEALSGYLSLANHTTVVFLTLTSLRILCILRLISRINRKPLTPWSLNTLVLTTITDCFALVGILKLRLLLSIKCFSY